MTGQGFPSIRLEIHTA